MTRFKATAAKDFDLAPDCRTTVHVKEGDPVEVPLSSARGMIDAGQIKEPKNFAEMLAGAMTTKSDEPKPVEEMTKNELEEYAREKFDVELDRRKSRAVLLNEIAELEEKETE